MEFLIFRAQFRRGQRQELPAYRVIGKHLCRGDFEVLGVQLQRAGREPVLHGETAVQIVQAEQVRCGPPP